MATKIVGLDKALKSLKDFGKRLEKEVQTESRGVARVVAAEIRRRTSKGPTGRSRRSIKYGPLKSRTGKPSGAFVRVDRRIAPHFHFNEFGTVNQPPRPSFRPVVDSINSGTFEPVRRGAKKAIKETKP